MLISKTVEIVLNPANMKYYEDLGYTIPKIKNKWGKYKTPRGTTILVKIEDLQEGSHIKVKCICDYCLINEIDKEYKIYLRENKNGIIHKDCCYNCRNNKVIESNQFVYGIDNTFLVEEYKEKSKISIMCKYGTDNVLKNEDIKRKIKNTNLERYNVINPMQNLDIQNKAFSTNLSRYGFKYLMQNNEILEKSKKSLYRNNSYVCSKQQLYLYKIFGGELNYPIGILSLDIAFPEDKIYLEYNGGGHNLQVKLGKMTEEEFKIKEIKRYQYLKSLGWKCININSPKDILFSDDILLKEFNNAISWFKSNENGHWHYNIDIN